LVSLNLERVSWPANPQIFRQLVENANVAIDVADEHGFLTYANRAAANMYGYESPQQMISHNVSELYHSDEEKRIAGDLIMQTQTPQGWIGETTHKRADGTSFPVELAVFGLHDPEHETISFGAIIQNMSEHRQLLSSLRQQARRLEALNRIGT